MILRTVPHDPPKTGGGGRGGVGEYSQKEQSPVKETTEGRLTSAVKLV